MDRTASSVPLITALAAHSAAPPLFVRIAATLFVTVLVAAAAQVSVPLPFTAVPFTLQPMVVLLGGLALGSRLGFTSLVLYLAAGVAGLPVFAPSPVLPDGALRLLGPTGGYLLSYPAAAWVTGALAERGFDRRYVTSIAAMFAGLMVIYACGAVWLGFFVRDAATGAPAGLNAALAAGVYPFILADALKLLAAAGTLPGLWALFGRARTL